MKFSDLWKHHPDTNGPGQINNTQAYPCDSTKFINQCAIRMSRAAMKSGMDFSDYPDPTCRGKDDFSGLDYSRGAESLANYFWAKFRKSKLPKPFIINRTAKQGEAAKQTIANKTGIIFFKDIRGFRGGDGDHIDLWDGTRTTGGEYFNNCTSIWFWEIK